MTILLLILTALIFLGIDYYARRGKVDARVHSMRSAPAFRFPDGIYFSKTHTWMTLASSGSVQLGADDFAGRMFAHPQTTLLKNEGDPVRKGEAIIRLEDAGRAIALRSPIDGRILRRNPRLAGGVNDDVLTRNWAYRIAPEAGPSIVREFFLGTEMRQWMKTEFSRLRDVLAHAHATPAGFAFLQDGGEPMPGVLNTLSIEDCARVEEEFFASF